MMAFRTTKTALIDLLGDNAAGQFRVLGYQRQNKAATDLKDERRLVQVYYSEGQFPKSAGRFKGALSHDVTFDIDISASKSASGAVNILESETATEAQKAEALASMKNAADLVDESIDEVIEAVFLILMDARNSGLLLDKGFISSRWIDRVQKDTVVERGDLVVKTANIRYTCRVQEEPPGDTGNTPDTVIYDTSLDGDTKAAGATVENINT